MISINGFYNPGDLCQKTHSCVAGQASKTIQWLPIGQHQEGLDNCYMHGHLLRPDVKPNAMGLIWESRAIIPGLYQALEQAVQQFRVVYTPDSHLLENFSNTRWCPAAGIWIGGSMGEGENKIHTKSKMVSFVSSAKRMCPLHEWRYGMAKAIGAHLPTVDVFLGENGWQPIYKSLHDYRFSVVVENNIDKWYFTEKIMNCFATGTIPIYVGATEIGKYFDTGGIIMANDYVGKPPIEFAQMLNSLTEQDYLQRYAAVVNNYELVQKFRSIEDYIHANYF